MALYKLKYFFIFVFAIVMLITASKPTKSQLGVMYFTSYRYEDAYKILRDVSVKDIDNIVVLKKLKDYFVLQGEIKQALKIQVQLVALRPKNIPFLQELEKLYDWNQMPFGRLLTMEKRADITKDLLSRNKLYNDVGNGLRWLKKYKDANRVFAKISNNKDLGIMINMSQYYMATKQKDRAIVLLEKVAHAKDIPFQFREKLAQTYVLNRNYDLAIYEYKMIFTRGDKKSAKDGVAGFIGKDKKYIFENLDLIETIIDLYNKILKPKSSLTIRSHLYKIFIDRASFRYAYADALYRNNRKEEALIIFKTLEDVQTSREFYQYEIAQRYFEMGLFKDSIKSFLECIRISPKTKVYYYELARVYEEIGEKRKALQTYYELLKIEQNNAMIQMFKANLIASNSLVYSDSRPRIILAQSDYTPKQLQRIQELKLKIADLHEELDEKDEAIKVLEGIKRKKDDINITKKLSERYFWSGNLEKSAKLSMEIIEKEPHNQTALHALTEYFLSKNEYDKAHEYYSQLNNDFRKENALTYLSLGEEIYFNLNEAFIHDSICGAFFNRYDISFEKRNEIELRIRCHRRNNRNYEALNILEELVRRNPDNYEYRTELIYVQLEEKKILDAKENMDYLKNHNQMRQVNKEQEKFLADLLWDYKENNSWSVYGDLKNVNFGQFAYNQFTTGVRKAVQGEFFYGLEYSKTSFSKGNTGSFNLVSPYVGYISKFKKREYNVTLKYDMLSGDKKTNSSPFHLIVNGSPHQNAYMSIQYRNSEVEIGGAQIANTDHVSRGTFETYYQYNIDKTQSVEADVTRNKLKYSNESASSYTLYGEYLRELKWYSPVRIGARSYLARFSSDGNSPTLNSLYVQKSFVNYIVGQYELLYNYKRNQRFEFLFKPAIGMDLDRDIGFGKMNNIFTSLKYIPQPNTYVSLYYDYLSESSVQNTGSVKTIGLNFKYLF
jgi:predicted Zn-dependent protease